MANTDLRHRAVAGRLHCWTAGDRGPWLRARHTASQAGHHPDVRRYVRRTTARTGTRSVLSVWTALTHSFSDQPARRSSVPLLIMHGADDRTGIIATEAPRWARHEPGSTYLVVPHAKHNAHQDDPATVASAIQSFADALTGPARGY
jgi:3-oxoadipate enol-lactonase